MISFSNMIFDKFYFMQDFKLINTAAFFSRWSLFLLHKCASFCFNDIENRCVFEILHLRCDHSCLRRGSHYRLINKLKGRESQFSVVLESSLPHYRSVFLLHWVLLFTVESIQQRHPSSWNLLPWLRTWLLEFHQHCDQVSRKREREREYDWQLCACQMSHNFNQKQKS